MSLSLYIDENVPEAITEGLRRRGIDVLTVQEDDRAGLPDPEVLDWAGELGRVLFTQDRDFLQEAARRQQSGEQFPGVIYAHQARVSVGRCVKDLEIVVQILSPQEMAQTVQRLPIWDGLVWPPTLAPTSWKRQADCSLLAAGAALAHRVTPAGRRPPHRNSLGAKSFR